MKSHIWFAVGTCGLLMAGCTTVMIGAKPDPIAPKIVVATDNSRSWDRPGAFGPVPPAVQARGDAVCARSDVKGRALGFHPDAQDVNGKPFVGGGFLCGQ